MKGHGNSLRSICPDQLGVNCGSRLSAHVQRKYTFRSPFQSILIVPEHSWEGESQLSCLPTQDALPSLDSTPH